MLIYPKFATKKWARGAYIMKDILQSVKWESHFNKQTSILQNKRKIKTKNNNIDFTQKRLAERFI